MRGNLQGHPDCEILAAAQDCAYAKPGAALEALLAAAAHLAHAAPAAAQAAGSALGAGGFQSSHGRVPDISAAQQWPQHWSSGKPGTCSVRQAPSRPCCTASSQA